MVRITLYDPKVSAEVYSQRRAAEESFESGVATGLARLGRALTERETGFRAAGSEVAGLESALGFWESEQRLLDAAGAKIPRGKPGFHDAAMRRHLERRRQEIVRLKEEQGVEAATRFERHTQALTGMLERRAGAMEAAASGDGLADGMAAAMTRAVSAVKSDPLQHDAIVEAFDATLAEMEANGVDPTGIAGTREAVRRNVGMAAVNGLIGEREFEAVRELLAEDRLPGLAEEDRKHLGRQLQRAEARAAAEGEAETAAAIDAFWAGFREVAAELRLSREVTGVDYADETIRRVLPEDQAEKMIALRTEAEDAGAAYGPIAQAAPEAIDALIANAPPDEARHLRAAARERERLLAEDPAAYVLGNARLRAMRDAMLAAEESGDAAAIAASSRAFVRASAAEQRRLGVREADRWVLPTEMAAGVVAAFMASDRPDPSGLGAGLRKRFGDRWRPVLEDLKRHGLPDGMAAIAAMDRPDQQAAARRLSSLIGTPTSELTSGLNDQTVREIETRLNGTGPESENARRLALSLASEGEDSKTASDYAAKQTTKRPDVDDVDGSRDSIWQRRPYSVDQQSEIQALFDDILSATKDELPSVESRIFAVFADSPSFAERVAVQARSVIHNTGQNTIQPENARRQIAEWVNVIAAGGEPDAGRAAHWRSFVELEREAPYRLTPADGGHVAFTRVGETAPFLTLPHSIAGRLAGDHENFAEVLEFLAEWRNGNLTGEDLKTEAERLFLRSGALGFTVEELTDEFVQTEFFAGEPVTADLIDRTAVEALLEADQALSDGADEAAVIAALMPALAPELFKDGTAELLLGLVLDVMPIIGNIRSARDAVEDFEALRAAMERGDWVAASQAGLFTALGVAGAVPGLGSLLGPIARRARLAAREIPGIRIVDGRIQVWQWRWNFNRRLPASSPEEFFGPTWHAFTADEQRSIGALFPKIIGNSGEHFAADTLERAAARVVRRDPDGRPQQLRLDIKHPDTGEELRRFADIQVDESNLRPLAKWLFGFGRTDGDRAVFEIKVGNSEYKATQADFDEFLRDDEKSNDIMRLLRFPLEEIPAEYLVAETMRLLDPWVKGQRRIRFTREQVDSLITGIRSQRQANGQGATVFHWLMTLASIEATERSLEEGLMESQFGVSPSSDPQASETFVGAQVP